jgi:lysophospholipase L1-like esterase
MKSARVLASTALLFLAVYFPAMSAAAQSASNSQVWVASWAASQQIPEPHNALAPDDLRNATVRQFIRLSVGGSTLRVHISNAFGVEPLQFASVHIARPLSPASPNPASPDTASPDIDPKSDRALTFSGESSVIVPAGTEYISDPIEYPAAPLSILAISFHIDAPPTVETGHPGSRETTWYLHGDFVSAATLPEAGHVDHWYQLSGIDVLASPGAGSIVAFGDSITDGHAATTNGNDRWTDVLAERLQASPGTRAISVLNKGIGGNHILTDGLGPNTLARFDRDVLAPAGIRWLILFEGVNDLGGLSRMAEASAAEHGKLVSRILSAYQQIVVRAHAHGIRAIGATITPFTGSEYYHPGPATEADRQAINAWIRTPGHFDAFVDFDKTLRDPSDPTRLLPAYDCGDHLHPNPAGYKALGEAVPLVFFAN